MCLKALQFDRVLAMVRVVRGLGMEACCTLGMLTDEQAAALAAAGLTAYNHNLDTSPGVLRPASSPRGPTTIGWPRSRACGRPASRSAAAASSAWAKTGASATACCGSCRSLDPHPESVPVNLLVRVDGTPLGDLPAEDPFELVRTIATARILMPASIGPPERRPAVAFRRSAGALLSRRRQLDLPRRSPADHAQSWRGPRPAPARQARHAPHSATGCGVRDSGFESQIPNARIPRARMGTGNSLEARVRARLDEWRDAGSLRTLQAPAGRRPLVERLPRRCPGTHGSSSGWPRPPCATAAAAPVRACSAASATHSSALEARFARFKGTERSLYFSSGYLANIAVMTAMTERGDVIFSDERNHASLIDGIRLSAAARVVFPA